jgi:hypothetical protein
MVYKLDCEGKFLLACGCVKTALFAASPRICAAIASPNTAGFPLPSLLRGSLQSNFVAKNILFRLLVQ